MIKLKDIAGIEEPESAIVVELVLISLGPWPTTFVVEPDILVPWSSGQVLLYENELNPAVGAIEGTEFGNNSSLGRWLPSAGLFDTARFPNYYEWRRCWDPD